MTQKVATARKMKSRKQQLFSAKFRQRQEELATKNGGLAYFDSNLKIKKKYSFGQFSLRFKEHTKVTKRLEITLSRASTNERDGWRRVSCYHYPTFLTKIPTRTDDFRSISDSDAKH